MTMYQEAPFHVGLVLAVFFRRVVMPHQAERRSFPLL
jgi:hypothetical protein